MKSSTSFRASDTPAQLSMPRHVAIIMDGNGRWATGRMLPRILGHKRGQRAVRTAVEYAIKHDIRYLTLFAFSSENWGRPEEEVRYLMQLFENALSQEIIELQKNQIQLKIIGDLSRFSDNLQRLILEGEKKTASGQKLVLTIAANYGGRWDIVNAMKRALQEKPDIDTLTEETVRPYFSLNYAPAPDLFIRTGGERRLSNFLLWDMAYTELYFTDTLWPDFDHVTFDDAIAFYQQRERRFGRIAN